MTRYLKIGILVAVAALLVLLVLLVQEYRHVHQLAYINGRGPTWVASLHHRAQPLGATDVGMVQTWMTFDYINHLFALPPQYLQTKLAITDTHYPRLTIVKYAAQTAQTQAASLSQVQGAIHSFFETAPLPQPSQQ